MSVGACGATLKRMDRRDQGAQGPVGMPERIPGEVVEGQPFGPPIRQERKAEPPAGHDCYALVRHPVQGRGAEYQCPSCGTTYVVKKKQPAAPGIGSLTVGGL